jgi:hypothetical protein
MWADKRAFFLVVAILVGALGFESALGLAGATQGLPTPTTEHRLPSPSDRHR